MTETTASISEILAKLTVQQKVCSPLPAEEFTANKLLEQATLLAGRNFWETQAIPEAGIPSLRVS